MAKLAALLAAAMAISTPVAAQTACAPAAGLTFICGLTNAEDLVQVPDTPWVIASGMAEGADTQGHIYLVNTQDHRVQVLLPGHVVYRQDSEAFAACPGAPDETRFSAHGLSLRVGSGSEHTLYVVHHGERESVEVFKLKVGPSAPTLTWVGCVVDPAGVFGNGVAALPGGAFAASKFLSTDDPKAFDKLMAGKPEGGMLIWRPKTGWEDVPEAATISADNGVAASPDGKQLFVAGSGDETVVRLSLASTPGSSPSDRVVIKTGFHTDNLRWGSDGFLYASGARDTLANLAACAPNTKQRCTGAFSALRIDAVTLQTREVVHHPGAPNFGDASTTLRFGDEYWFATPHGDRIAIAPAD
jgi:WD40 repeat protein